jgi:hypothetical protein
VGHRPQECLRRRRRPLLFLLEEGVRDGIGVGAVMSGAQPVWLGLGQREHGGYFESHGLE